MINENNYVLLLVYINKERKDIAGNYYPENGFIRHNEFESNMDLMSGFYGIKWGKIDSLYYEDPNGQWVVVKTEDNKNLIFLDKNKNKYKFKEGLIVYYGCLDCCYKYIIDNKDFMPERLRPRFSIMSRIHAILLRSDCE